MPPLLYKKTNLLLFLAILTNDNMVFSDYTKDNNFMQ